MCLRNPIECIVPPDLLEKLLEKTTDPHRRAKLLNSINLSAFTRGQRAATGLLPTSLSAGAAGGKRRAIYDGQNGFDLPGTLKRREGDAPSSDAAVNEAYDGFGATYDLYLGEYGRNSIDDQGMVMVGTVHHDRDYNNAFWDGTQMVFGDGDGIDFIRFTKSLDVIGHELTHGVVQYTSNLIYQFQPGALNESFADVFGSLVKQRVRNQAARDADWLIGDDIFTPDFDGDALRSMKAPGTAFNGDRSVGHMRDFLDLPLSSDRGGVHWNSGIPNRAFFFLATELGGNAWRDAGKIWYLTMRRLTRFSEFQEAANVTFAAAGELFGTGSSQQQAVRGAWDQVGIQVGRTTLGPPGKTARGTSVDGQADGFDAKFDKLSETIAGLANRVEELGKKVETKGRR